MRDSARAMNAAERARLIEQLRTSLPQAMRERRQWLIWKLRKGKPGEKPRKVPYYVSGDIRTDTQGSDADRAALATLEGALGALQSQRADGVGFAFLPGDGLVGIDIDRAIDGDGVISERCRKIIEACASYTELSPSGTGFHIIVEGETETFKDNRIGVEVFCGRQFFTCTGRRWAGTPPEVAPLQDATLRRLRATVKGTRKAREGVAPAPTAATADKGAQRYCLAALESAVQRMRGTSEGGRNDALNTEAFGLAQLVHTGGISEATIRAALADAARSTGLADAEIQATLRSAISGGLQQPRSLPERTRPLRMNGHAAPAGRADASAGEKGLQVGQPEGEAAPRKDPFTVDERGVWHMGRDREGNTKSTWICAPLHVAARTRAEDTNGWGFLLEFSDPDGNAKTWAMPAAMLSGDGAEWAGRLRDMGLRMAPGSAARNLVAQYIDTRDLRERVTCTDRVGWHEGGIYVLPSGCIASAAVQAAGRRYVFQSDAGMDDTFRQRGELADWRQGVARLAEGNSRLIFALCCAFGGPLLHLAGMEGGGIHLRGKSSKGKTTTLRVAGSVWGSPSYMQRWNATMNAVESTAVQHGDALLVLDELSQLDARVAGEVAYLLANGQEKGRSTRTGLMRKRRAWRLLFLSSGEVSLAGHMAEAGQRARAGMDVRMVDVPLEATPDGSFEELHGFEHSAHLAEAMTAACAKHYGTAGRAWLTWCCEQFEQLPRQLLELVDRTRDDLVPEAAAEQVRRVGSRFALIAAAGELASQAGITGWQEGRATWAVRQCFNAWLAARGHLDNGEDEAMEGQVRAWIEKGADAQLTWVHRLHDDHRPATVQRAGFKRLVDDAGEPLKFDAATDYLERRNGSAEREAATIEYLLLPEAFKRDVCRGFDAAAVAEVLRSRGHLVHRGDGLTDRPRLPQLGRVTVYRIKSTILGPEGT